jgi:hypothetical protein
MVREDQCPHPRRSYRRGIGLEDAADNFTVRQRIRHHSISPDGREADARFMNNPPALPKNSVADTRTPPERD